MAGKKITKLDILDLIYQKTGMSRKEIREVVDLFLGDIKGALVKGVSVELRGFGTFEARIRKGRSKARNPRTGTAVTVNSHGVAAFRPGRELKQDIWPLGSDGADALPSGSTGEGDSIDGKGTPQSGGL